MSASTLGAKQPVDPNAVRVPPPGPVGPFADPAASRGAERALLRIRDEIDRVDEHLLDLIQQRQRLALATLSVKESSGLATVDVSREAAVVTRSAKLARERGLEPELVRDIFWRLIELSRLSQQESLERGSP